MSVAEPSWRGAILFDLDGTLIDSVPDITLAVNELMALDGLAPFADDDIRRMVGYGLTVLVQRAYAARQFTSPQPDARLDEMRSIYGRHLTGRTVLIPGARETLRQLWQENWRIAVVTNKLQTAAETILRHFELTQYLTLVLGDGAGLALKPAPDMLLAACRQLAMPVQRAYMVGDSPADIAAARAANIRSVVLRGGYTSEPVESLGADRIIDELPQLAVIV